MAEGEAKGNAERGTRNAEKGKRSVQIRDSRSAFRDHIDIPSGWVPRPDQRPLWDYLEKGGRRAVCVAHRRWGKDDVALHFTATQMIERPGNYWHMLPQYNQARKVIWDALNPKTGRRRVDEAFPRWVRAKTHEREMFLEFTNGATWQLVGSDRYDSLVGSAPVGIVFSEYAVADPMAWAYLRPILAANDGWALFIYTPRGANHGKSLYDFAKAEMEGGHPIKIGDKIGEGTPLRSTNGERSVPSTVADATGVSPYNTWFTQLLPADRTPVFTPDRLDQERRELLAEFGETEGEMLFLQEYYCSFEGGSHGAYYSKQLKEARTAGRITAVPHAAGHEVYTFWDLGMDDSTSIWFMQAIGRELRFIDYYEAQGEGLAHYARVLKEKPYVYGDHYMPHDADVRELGTGTSRRATAENLGIRPVIVVQRARDTQAVLSGIEQCRNIMSQCWFDGGRCARGISALEGYRCDYDQEKKKLADHPLHNWCSHGADAFRTCASGFRPKVKSVQVTSIMNGIDLARRW